MFFLCEISVWWLIIVLLSPNLGKVCKKELGKMKKKVQGVDNA